MIGRLDHDSLLLLDSMKVRILRVIRIAYVLPKNQLTFLSDDPEFRCYFSTRCRRECHRDRSSFLAASRNSFN